MTWRSQLRETGSMAGPAPCPSETASPFTRIRRDEIRARPAPRARPALSCALPPLSNWFYAAYPRLYDYDTATAPRQHFYPYRAIFAFPARTTGHVLPDRVTPRPSAGSTW